MAGKKKVVNNLYQNELLEIYINQEMPFWVDDVITGASRSQDSTKISPNMLLAILTAYPTITTLEIKTFLNRKREAIEGRVVSDETYLRDIRRACSCAVNAITYQLEKGRKWSDQEYIRGSLEVMVNQFDRFNNTTLEME